MTGFYDIQKARRRVTGQLLSDIKRGKIKPAKKRNFEEEMAFEKRREELEEKILVPEVIKTLVELGGHTEAEVRDIYNRRKVRSIKM